MKFEDLKLVQKWREYAGPKDERLEAESAKIYKIGFVLLSFGMLMIFFYQFIARQVAWVHSDASEMLHGFATPFEAAMYLWLVLVMLICAGLQTRKAMSIPIVLAKPSIFLLDISCLSAVLAAPRSRLLLPQCAVSLRRRSYRSKASFGWRTWPRACSAVQRFSRPRLLPCAQRFFTAKRRRAKLEAELDSTDDI